MYVQNTFWEGFEKKKKNLDLLSAVRDIWVYIYKWNNLLNFFIHPSFKSLKCFARTRILFHLRNHRF